MLLNGPARPRGPGELTGPGAWLDRRLPQPELRRALRDWRRRRPFWGGLLLILGGLELVAVPLSPLTVLVSLGLGGLAAIGIGLALTVAGLFLWLAPHTRHYVSINALLLSVLSFAATNLGGFLVGMLLGIAGSALGFGWTPLERAEDRESEEGRRGEAAEAAPGREATPDRPLPPGQGGSLDSGGSQGSGSPGGAGNAGGEPGGGPPGQRTLAVALPVVLLAALGGAGTPSHAQPHAQPRGTAPSAGPGAPVEVPHAQALAPGGPAAAPGAPVEVPDTPPTVTTTLFAPEGFTLAGVREVATSRGPLKVMVLRMKAASLTDYRLRTRDRGENMSLGADSLHLSGQVTLYLTKFSGCLEGLLCLTFTPESLPVPPVVPPFVFMTQVEAEQALVTSDVITVDGLTLGAGPGAAAEGAAT
ncbi:DUF6114 domain-containing protein [Streptomyces iconiensis]|uniref:DUF6114 domain-containing protein n=1 Tax=Streptomyces iconiensis TaxID=1384038 RepID=A0ABT6ZS79_9ACTN|nr:DUF6114 domain-containing protein [Streptomyces iconiensis]MDJ1131323.1 DUF6114 domain-containing protein [Streptomyces iconiensis]